jgi:hypothetical protein
MATSKIPKVEELNAYFFLSVQGKDVQVVYHDDSVKGLALGAAFASVLQEDKGLFDIFSSAFLTAIEAKDKLSVRKKYVSKKSNKVQIPVKKAAKKK